MDWIQEIRFGTSTEGSHSGLVGYHIYIKDFNHEYKSGIVDYETAVAIETLCNHKAKNTLVRLHCDLDRQENISMWNLIKVLIDNKYVPVIKSNGRSHLPYFSLIESNGWLIVELVTSIWPAFICNELWYYLDSATASSEPLLARGTPRRQNGSPNTCLYLVQTDGFPTEKLFDFIKKSNNSWNILTKTSEISVEVPILGEKK